MMKFAVAILYTYSSSESELEYYSYVYYANKTFNSAIGIEMIFYTNYYKNKMKFKHALHFQILVQELSFLAF